MAESLYASLEPCFKTEEEDTSGLPELSKDEWDDFIITLGGFVEAYDIDDLKMMIEMMKGYHLAEEYEIILKDIKDAAKGPDWTRLSELLKSK
jgi:hypothetical protein